MRFYLLQVQVFFGNYGQCAYAAAKEGIRGLTRVAATEWAKDGVMSILFVRWHGLHN